jgi:hypothetical protein
MVSKARARSSLARAIGCSILIDWHTSVKLLCVRMRFGF